MAFLSHFLTMLFDRTKNPPQTDLPFSLNFCLSVATFPVLVGLWGAQQCAVLLQEVSQLSEEIFRGDRLPVLNVPPETAIEISDEAVE
jgi:hypothetical protein